MVMAPAMARTVVNQTENKTIHLVQIQGDIFPWELYSKGMAGSEAYVGDTTKLTVVQIPGDTYQWEIYLDGTVDFAITSGNCPITSAIFVRGNTGSIVNVKWLKTGTYYFKVTAYDAANCTDNLKIGIVTVKDAIPTAVLKSPDPICAGATSIINVALTGTAPWDVTFTDEVKTWTVTSIKNSPYSLEVKPNVTTNYSVTQVKDKYGINLVPASPVQLKVQPKPFSSKIYQYLQATGQDSVIDKVCLGAARQYRTDGEAGSTYLWTLTDASGSQVLLTNPTGTNFTGTNQSTGQPEVGSEVIIQWAKAGIYKLAALQYSLLGCDTLQNGKVLVFPKPSALAGNPRTICTGETVSLGEATATNYASLLWSSSGDGVFNNSNTLNPIYTPGVNDQLSGNVVLTLTAQGVGSSDSCTPALSSLNVTITNKIVPSFNAIGPLFVNSVAPLLPSRSTNIPPIIGLWNPGTISTVSNGVTTYTFTSESGQCALNTTMDITVASQIIPTFIQIGPFCQNSVAQPLPTSSNNTPPVTGTWNPATINTSAPGVVIYTFTPDLTQNATSISMSIEITTPVTPIFTPIGLLYEHSIPPTLSSISNNVPPVTGSWTPAVINTANVNITTYTFNPDSSQCAFKSTLLVQVVDDVTPTFAPIGPFCQNSMAPPLPITSLNGITGTWSPGNINTTTPGISPYIFTPDIGQGASNATIFIKITPEVTPTFDVIAPMCASSANPLPVTSLEGITGTWSPAFDNSKTTTYTFTPTAGQCSVNATLTVTITDGTVPTFGVIAPMCAGSANPLPSKSIEGITGTWSPAFDNSKTTTYTFTPTAGQCAVNATLTITITDGTVPTFGVIAPICAGGADPLPVTSLQGIKGTWSPAFDNTKTTNYTFTPTAGQCAVNATLSLTVINQITPVFTAIGPLCLNSTTPALPRISANGITGTWNPASISTASAGNTTYIFTPATGQCAGAASMKIIVNDQTLPTFTAIGPLCLNTTAPLLPTTSNNGITGTWSPATINTSVAGTTNYTFTSGAGQCGSNVSKSITVNNQTLPLFAAIGSLCQNSAAPLLPVTSTNGINGVWNPATISTATAGTKTYTFTPAAGQCASITTKNVTINALLTPSFSAVASICQNGAAPVLPIKSINGITGTWNPASVNTSTPGTVNYTFTPASGQCAIATTISITIDAQITPTFSTPGSICQNSIPPILPATSSNGITGRWSPATINTVATGTKNYTFTPTAGQCTTPLILPVTILPQTTPAFDAIQPICQNTPAPALPTTSNNGISGNWNPAAINVATIRTSTYTFTPIAGQCADNTTLSVTIYGKITPILNAIGPICQNSTPPILPQTSSNGITGTWNPTLVNTSQVGTTTYNFAPEGEQCARIATLDITIVSEIFPTFAQIGPLCQNSTPPPLPTSSTNGIKGKWTPASISSDVPGTSIYNFTPDAGQCAVSLSMEITTNSSTTPTFDAMGSLCQNSIAPTLPTTSTNGITGTWNPSNINTTLAGTNRYTFTPDAGPCANKINLDITVVPQIIPAFVTIGPLCQNSIAPTLANVSLNGIAGTWAPANISTVSTGTTTYNFTPTSGQCATNAVISITINPPVTPDFTQIGPLCYNSTAPILPLHSSNEISGTWSPSIINTSQSGMTSYLFTPASNQCATTATMDISTNPQTNTTFSTLGPICQNSKVPALSINSTNIPAVSGTWNPSTINTSKAGTTTYTFTPNSTQCASEALVDIVIEPLIMPLFNPIDPICKNSPAPLLQLISTNGIAGTWNPAAINTSATGTSSYTFTPNSELCALPTTMNISIVPNVLPSFDQIASLCQNSTPLTLPLTSKSGIVGQWSPSLINTSLSGTSNYIFTPDEGQCAAQVSMNIIVNTKITPTFAKIGPLCQNSQGQSLSLKSINGITGTWSPGTIDTSSAGISAYVFTPDTGICADQVTLNIQIDPLITPEFGTIGPICQNSTAPSLSLHSINGINGKWSPNVINTNLPGTTTYTFKPDACQCSTSTTMNIEVLQSSFSSTDVTICSAQLPYSWNGQSFNSAGTYKMKLANSDGCDSVATLNIKLNQAVTPTFTQIAPLMQNSVAPMLPDTSLEGIKGKWSPDSISTSNGGTATYTFTPESNLCVTSTTMDISVQIDAIITGQTVTGLCQQSNLDASKSIGDIVKYEWTLLDNGGILDIPTGITSTFRLSPGYTGSFPAKFRVKLQITSQHGVTRSDTLTIKVDALPVANVTSSGSLEKDGSMIIDGSVSTGTEINYKWSTSQGKIIGPDNQSSVKLFGEGIYKLEVSDIHGCLDSKTFKYPMEFHSLIANPDYARISWEQDTTINVLANDHSTVYLMPQTVVVTSPPSRGGTKVNADGTIKYTPEGKNSGFDKFIYEVCDTLHFCTSATVTIEIYNTGLIIPEGFSPNGDGLNDFFYIEGIKNLRSPELYVYTRSGQLVFKSLDYGKNDNYWDGKMENGQRVPTGTYYYVIQVTYPDRKVIKGFVYIGY